MNLVTRTKNLVEPMNTYDIDTSTWGVWIVPIIVRKLDPASRAEWCTKRPQKCTPLVKPLLDFITLRADGIDESALSGSSNRFGNNFQNRNYQHGNHNNGQQQSNNNHQNSYNSCKNNNSNAAKGQKKPVECPDSLCRAPNNEHQLFNCKRFMALDLEHRRQKAKILRVCETCLRKNCKNCSMRPCHKCNERHNSWLCHVLNRPPTVCAKQSVHHC